MQSHTKNTRFFFMMMLALFSLGNSIAKECATQQHQQKQKNTLEVKKGEEFTISLDSNPSTGYSWHMTNPPSKYLIEFVGSEHKPPKKGLIGASGVEEWKFKALNKTGNTFIEMKYYRPWKKDVPAAETKTYKVYVK